MKWIVKQFAGEWVTRCPRCHHLKRRGNKKPPDTWVCQCGAVVNEETCKRMDKLSKVISKVYAQKIKEVAK